MWFPVVASFCQLSCIFWPSLCHQTLQSQRGYKCFSRYCGWDLFRLAGIQFYMHFFCLKTCQLALWNLSSYLYLYSKSLTLVAVKWTVKFFTECNQAASAQAMSPTLREGSTQVLWVVTQWSPPCCPMAYSNTWLRWGKDFFICT